MAWGRTYRVGYFASFPEDGSKAYRATRADVVLVNAVKLHIFDGIVRDAAEYGTSPDAQL